MIDLLALAQECAPDLPPAVVVAIAKKESAGNVFAVGHASVTKQPQNFGDAVQIMDDLAQAGKRYDAGLMQISSANFEWLGLDNVSVLSPCENIAAAQKIILENLRLDGAQAESFFNAISRYNTGNASYGYKNGYVDDVALNILNADQIPAKLLSTQEIAMMEEKQKSKTAAMGKNDWARLGDSKGLFSQAKKGGEKNTGLFTASLASKATNTENDGILSAGREDATVHHIQRLDGENQSRASNQHAIDPARAGEVAMYD